MKTSTLSLALISAVVLAGLPALAAPDNALKDAMKKMQAQVTNGDAKSLVPFFDVAKSKAKPEFANWIAIAEKGKSAAAAGDLDGAKATCKTCHEAYRADYKTKYGSKAP